MRSLKRNTSILHMYFTSYIAIFAIPLVILGIVLYSHAIIELQNEVERYTQDKVIRMKNTLDARLLETKKTALKISSDENIKPHMVNLNDYRSKNAIDQLNRYWDKNLIDNLFVCFRNEKYLYGVAGKTSFDTFFANTIGIDYNTSISFANALQKTDKSMFLGISGIPSGSSKNIDNLICLYPLPLGGVSSYGVLGIIINQGTIENLAGDILGNSKGSVFIYNEDMQRIFTIGDKDFFPSERVIEITGGNYSAGVSKSKFEGRNYSVIKTVSEESGFHFIVIMSPESYLNRVIIMRKQVMVIIFGVILTGILLAYVFSRKNYKPIKVLFEKMNNYTSLSEQKEINEPSIINKKVNEIEGIEKMIKNIVDKNYGLTEQLNHHQSFVRDQILLMLLKGQLNEKENIKDLLALYNMKFDYLYSYVSVISIQKVKEYETTAAELSLYIKGVIDSKLKNKQFYWIDTVQGDFVLLVNTTYENCSKIMKVNLLKDIQIFLQNNLGLKINIGVGRVYDNISQISISFMEALSTLDYKLLIGYGNIIFFDEMVSSDTMVYWYPVEEQIRLSQCIKQGNIYIFRDIIDDIIDSIKEKHLPIGITRTICFGMINTIIEVLNEFNIKDFDSDVEELTTFTSLDDLKNKMENVVYKICKYISEKKESNNETLKIAIIEYIHENYTNNMFNLDMVADKFNISSKYLSRFFKQQIGFNFVDYMKELRINYSKKLLSETNLLIKDIVEQVGYSDVASFTRTFRQMEGITPGRFREMALNTVTQQEKNSF
ncbi:MAG TPA: helix-turn-helix domain-containing protein [Clostridiales bacterium]|nr:helix-turn-helix domain-containing protein [Clostridiales bacterium]